MAKKTADYWLETDLQPGVIASHIRQYTRYLAVIPEQDESDPMSFNDFVNQIAVRGALLYETALVELEMKAKK